jgi:hypothetical protein
MGLVFGESFLHSLEPGFKFDEGGSEGKVLDELGGFVDCGDGFVVLAILSDPDGVLGVSIVLL